ncbi:MAG: TlpA family protein disulfide reductase [Bacteroidales bacterium]|jgi:peroxiredoxin|nr:TlpA family protein disulfide reductase [Bacteroidales bacterium]
MKKLFLLTFLVVFGMAAMAQEVNSGAKIPSVTIKNIDGNSFNTQDISNDGKPIIISFWALWCKPCKLEMDAYNENYPEWVEETGVKIYAVSIDDARSTAKVLPFVSGKGWTMEMLLDPNSDFKRAMSVNMIPHTFILNGNGEVVYQHTSYYEGLEDEIFEILQKIAAGEDPND